ncbi:hypothetical protein KAR04_05705 [Candidatus Calescamantes bacterium]|nr:hypothetical protein [Candidatus Calescamantes bacterium]MCK5599625.1 hypothetical protein [bacterium]
MKIKYYFIVSMLLSLLIFADSGIFITGGVPIITAGMGGENFNPSYSISMKGLKFSATSDFNSEERHQIDLSLSLQNTASVFTIKYEDRLTSRKVLRFQWAVPLSETMIVGLGARNYFSDKNAFTFDAGFLMERDWYAYGVAVLNIGGLGVSKNFAQDFIKGIFPFINDPALNYFDADDNRLKQGLMTHFMVNNEKYYLGMQVNNYVSSIEDLKEFGWGNIKWGVIYKLPDGSYLGFGQNSHFNSAGAGFVLKKLHLDYAFLWLGKSFTYHMITMSVSL